MERFRQNHWRAPGADDNASGLAVITEIMRAFVKKGDRPLTTIEFMAFAAEEVGLRGSDEIAMEYRTRGIDVVAALNFDITASKTSKHDIYFIDDYTDVKLNKYMSSLADHYFPNITHGNTTCGYACSDHASWTKSSFPSAGAIEGEYKEINERIHTEKDTFEELNNDVEHMNKFARFGLAFAVEVTFSQKIADETSINHDYDTLIEVGIIFVVIFDIVFLFGVGYCVYKRRMGSSTIFFDAQHPSESRTSSEALKRNVSDIAMGSDFLHPPVMDTDVSRGAARGTTLDTSSSPRSLKQQQQAHSPRSGGSVGRLWPTSITIGKSSGKRSKHKSGNLYETLDVEAEDETQAGGDENENDDMTGGKAEERKEKRFII